MYPSFRIRETFVYHPNSIQNIHCIHSKKDLDNKE
jgi:hypothetical protein